ncbi:phosphatase PAP2 family protein [Bradyrhizobium sp. USDA 4369]
MLVLLWIFGAHAERRAAVDGGLSTLLALALAVAISSFWMHPRPFAVLQNRNFLNHAPDSSFPSDHSTVLFAMGLALWASASTPARRAGALAAALGLSVGWARVYLAAHSLWTLSAPQVSLRRHRGPSCRPWGGQSARA